MSQTTITLAFEQWKAQQGMTGEAVLLDEFVFASVPGLNPDQPIDRSEAMPPADQIVYRQSVTRKGVVNENAVVHSVVLGADVGDFSFNWIGLINKASGTLAMIVHAPVQQKLKTKEGQQGNVLTRSFLMEYNGAQTETGINTPAETWQIDFTARMAGMDERQRLENIDIYGAAAFFGDGWLVGKNGNQFYVTSGAGYVAGLRAQLGANQNITVTTMPVNVWLDVCWVGTLASAWEVQSKVTVAGSLADYEQNGVKHHVFALASIDANGVITDLRPKGSLGEQQANSDYVRKDKNLADLKDKAEARRTLGLKSAAQHDVTASSLDATPGRVMQTGDFGIGGETVSIPGGASIQSYFVGKPSGKYKGGADITNTAYPGAPWYEFDWMNHAADLYGFLVEYTAEGREAIHILANGKWSGVYYVLTSVGGSFNSTFKFGQVGTIGQERNAATLFSRQGGAGSIVSGHELEWYGNKMTTGIVRDAGEGSRGYAITLNGNQLLSIDPNGNAGLRGNAVSSGNMIGLQGDERKHFTIMNADGSARLYIWKDKGGDGVHLSNGPDGGGDYVFGKDGGFYAPSGIHAGSAKLGATGDVYGVVWGGWLSDWITNATPVGIPMPWSSPNPPPGWIICVGQAFNTSQYPKLAAAYPAGYLPDMRGVFIRGWDNGRGIDPGRGIASLQYGQAPASGFSRGQWGNYAQLNRGINVQIGTDNDGYPIVTQESESQRETRPINVAFNYIVRAA